MVKRNRKLFIRQASSQDIAAIVELSCNVYGLRDAFTAEELRGTLSHFPEGQFVAEYEGNVVGHCATFIIDESVAFKSHTWDEVTGHGFASRHDPKGDWLYGMEVCVATKRRGLRIGQRLYDSRKRLCEELGLKGIVFGGRMPGYRRRARLYPDPMEYVEAVKRGEQRDRVIQFQTSNDFEIIGVLPGYLPTDAESMGHAVHMIWRNPELSNHRRIMESQNSGDMKTLVRVATVQWQMRKLASLDEFESNIEYFVDVAADYRSDFVVFPELFSLQVLSLYPKDMSVQDAMVVLSEYEDRFREFMHNLSMSYNINIIAGAHPARLPGGEVRNTCWVLLRDGGIYSQQKIHPTPSESDWWNISGGDRLDVIPTDCGPIGVLICYDAEFPELARHITNQGALIAFVPFCTDERQGYLRVRYCSQARAVENQIYVVTSGVVGNLPGVENMDIHYAQSGVFTPCDFPFARDGMQAESPANTESVTFADLNLDNLIRARNTGTVLNLRNRRFDLYRVQWKGR